MGAGPSRSGNLTGLTTARWLTSTGYPLSFGPNTKPKEWIKMNERDRHAASIKMADDVIIKEAECFADPDFTNGNDHLSEGEIQFFKEQGFLLKRGFLHEPEVFSQVVDCVWSNVPRDLFRKEDPESWVGLPTDQWTEEDDVQVGQLQGGSWKMRSREGIGTEPFFLDGIANHPRMRSLVAKFIGEPIRTAKRVRGVYCQFPKPPGTSGKLMPHLDYTAGQLTAMVFVDDVPPKCGGFTLWPGSHTRLHEYWECLQSGTIREDRKEAYARARDAAVNEITPLEFPGHAGDVIFWHPRLLHSAGINHSAEFDRQIMRMIVPCDYQIDGRDFYDDLIHGPGPNHQWWVDTRHWRGDTTTTTNNMWEWWVFSTE